MQGSGVFLEFRATIVPELQHVGELLHELLFAASVDKGVHRALVITLRNHADHVSAITMSQQGAGG
jgi:hypothetical protein